jgi:hypothetical protein
MKQLFTWVILFYSFSSIAQVDTIYSIDARLIKKYLKPSSNQYMVFIQRKADPQQTFTFLWNREVKYLTRNGRELIEINQKWYGSDTTRNRYVYSLVCADNFLPVYHYSKMTKGTEAYNFYPTRIYGADSVRNNSKSGFDLTLVKPALNWELDLEIFPLLDLKPGKRFAVNFYHPGSPTEPKLYEYRVEGEDVVKTVEGPVQCWKLRIDYSASSYAVFYISKKGREVLRMDEDFGSGTRYKIKLSNAVPVL